MLFKNFLLPVTALAAVVIADGAAITEAMSVVGNDTTALGQTVGDWTGNPLTILEILVQSTKLLVDINTATDTAKDSANLTFTEGVDVAQATLSLSNIVQSTLSTIVAKKGLFDDYFLSGAILLNLKEEKKATDDFAAAVVTKLPAALQGSAAGLTQPIDNAFNSAISAYEQSSWRA